MPLKTLVKVGSITNLSDARYCAGMGVEMLGFRVISNTENHISPDLYQQIRGWVTGPKIVAEFYGATNEIPVQNIIRDYAPDYVELPYALYKTIGSKINLPLIVRIGDNEAFSDELENVAYIITNAASNMSIKKLNIPIIVDVALKADLDRLNVVVPSPGISLNGSSELRPGFKDYDDLAEILEALEE